jgi:hypothetical protein
MLHQRGVSITELLNAKTVLPSTRSNDVLEQGPKSDDPEPFDDLNETPPEDLVLIRPVPRFIPPITPSPQVYFSSNGFKQIFSERFITSSIIIQPPPLPPLL